MGVFRLIATQTTNTTAVISTDPITMPTTAPAESLVADGVLGTIAGGSAITP